MTSRHGAALVLIAWYLMMPPVLNKRVDPDAPLNQWINFGSFETSSECSGRLSDLRQNSGRVDTLKTLGLETTRLLHERDTFASCIASDDPRLKEAK